ncbi:MAG: LamG domain-containing protein, partial [Pseudomonadota bacterium]
MRILLRIFAPAITLSLCIVHVPVRAGELIAHYPFDDGVIDVTGNIEPIDARRAAPTDQGKHGLALKFDGDHYIEIPVNLSAKYRPEFTLSAWVKIAPPPSDEEALKAMGGYAVIISNILVVDRLNLPEPYFSAPVPGAKVSDGDHRARPGQWTHVVVTRRLEQREDRNGEMAMHVISTLMVNGIEVESVGLFRDQRHQTSIYLGAYNHQKRRPFRGLIDDLRIYDGVLDASERTALAKPLAPSRAFPGDNFEQDSPGPSIAAFPGDNFGQQAASIDRNAFPGDNFEGNAEPENPVAFPGDNFESRPQSISPNAFPGDNFENLDTPDDQIAFPGDQLQPTKDDIDPRAFPGDQFRTPPGTSSPTEFPGDQLQQSQDAIDPRAFPGDQLEPSASDDPSDDFPLPASLGEADPDDIAKGPLEQLTGPTSAIPRDVTTVAEENMTLDESILSDVDTADRVGAIRDAAEEQRAAGEFANVDWSIVNITRVAPTDDPLRPGDVIRYSVKLRKYDPANKTPVVLRATCRDVGLTTRSRGLKINRTTGVLLAGS